MAGAAIIMNLIPVTPTPAAVIITKPRRRTGGGDWPESNLYDPVEGDYNHPYYDEAVNPTINPIPTFADVAFWAKLLHDILSDQVGVEVAALQTNTVVDSDITDGQAAATSAFSVDVDVFEVVESDVDDGSEPD